MTEKKNSEMTYEKAAAELDEIIAKLEDGQLPLEQTLVLYERGQQLAQLCSDMLEKAELRIRVLAEEKQRGNEGPQENAI
jgi:exodeoxyribonuclease VII small subunit